MLLAKKTGTDLKIIPLMLLSTLVLSLCTISYAMTDDQYLDVYFGMAKRFYGGDQTVKAPFLDLIRHYLRHGDVNEGMDEVGKYSGKTVGQIVQEQTKSCPVSRSVDGVECCWGTNTGADCFENRCSGGQMHVFSCNAGQCVDANPYPCTCDTSEIPVYGHSHNCL